MSTPADDTTVSAGDPAAQPLSDGDSTLDPDAVDPAQAEWEGASSASTAVDEQEVPAVDQPGTQPQPESQGENPLVAELGEEGEGDLAPEDL